jgi:hypothetical protein
MRSRIMNRGNSPFLDGISSNSSMLIYVFVKTCAAIPWCPFGKCAWKNWISFCFNDIFFFLASLSISRILKESFLPEERRITSIFLLPIAPKNRVQAVNPFLTRL